MSSHISTGNSEANMQRSHVQNQLKNLLDNVQPNGEVEEEDLDELVIETHFTSHSFPCLMHYS